MAIGTAGKATKTKLLARLNLISWRHGESLLPATCKRCQKARGGLRGLREVA